MKRFLAGLLIAAAPGAHAEWRFDRAVDVAGPAKAFHHLSASGRKALAISAGSVALAWEDDHDGVPRCYLALKRPGEGGFRTRELGQEECYDPALSALDDGRFAVIREEGDGVKVALADASGTGPTLTLAPSGGQGSLTWHPRLGLHAAWSQPETRWRRIRLARLNIEGTALRAADASVADPKAPTDDQIFPALASGAAGHVLVWEDRRLGHTVVHASRSDDGKLWSAPLRVSRNPTGKSENNLGRGTGAMRPALAAYGGDRLAAVWLDKRDFLSGYDVYAALSADGGKTFSENVKVQDSFGDAIAQWHAAVAGSPGGALAVAWDDERDGTADVWLSWPTPAGYADNVAPTPAAGPRAQTDPAIALDDNGDLHLAWIERDAEGLSRLRYARGNRLDGAVRDAMTGTRGRD